MEFASDHVQEDFSPPGQNHTFDTIDNATFDADHFSSKGFAPVHPPPQSPFVASSFNDTALNKNDGSSTTTAAATAVTSPLPQVSFPVTPGVAGRRSFRRSLQGDGGSTNPTVFHASRTAPSLGPPPPFYMRNMMKRRSSTTSPLGSGANANSNAFCTPEHIPRVSPYLFWQKQQSFPQQPSPLQSSPQVITNPATSREHQNASPTQQNISDSSAESPEKRSKNPDAIPTAKEDDDSSREQKRSEEERERGDLTRLIEPIPDPSSEFITRKSDDYHYEIMRKWKLQAFLQMHLHQDSYYFYRTAYVLFSLPLVLLSTVASATSFATTFDRTKYAVASMNICATILAGIIWQFQPAETAQQHAQLAQRYRLLSHTVESALRTPVHFRSQLGAFMSTVQNELDVLVMAQVAPPKYVVNKNRKIFGPTSAILYGDDIVEALLNNMKTENMICAINDKAKRHELDSERKLDPKVERRYERIMKDRSDPYFSKEKMSLQSLIDPVIESEISERTAGTQDDDDGRLPPSRKDSFGGSQNARTNRRPVREAAEPGPPPTPEQKKPQKGVHRLAKNTTGVDAAAASSPLPRADRAKLDDEELRRRPRTGDDNVVVSRRAFSSNDDLPSSRKSLFSSAPDHVVLDVDRIVRRIP